MKKQLVMIAAALLLGTMAFGQAAGPRGGAGGGQGKGPGQAGQRGGGQGQMEKKIIDQLGLSAAQKKQWEAYAKARGEKMKAMREKMSAGGQKPDRQAMMAQMKKMQEENKASIKKILTPAQFTKFESLMKAEREKFMKERPQGAGGPGGPGGKGARGGKGGGF